LHVPPAQPLSQRPQLASSTSRHDPEQQSSGAKPGGCPGTQGGNRPRARQALDEPQRHLPPAQPSARVSLQTRPQPPQLATSLVVSTHRPLQQVSSSAQQPLPHASTPGGQHTPVPVQTSPAGHGSDPQTHSPEEQRSGLAQATPQPPQLAASVITFRHAPLQHASEAVQSREPQVQWPRKHVSPSSQALPHSPQWAVLVRTSTQAVPQHVSPSPQAGTQASVTQMPSAQSCSSGQRVPQPPQLSASVFGSTHSCAAPQQICPAGQEHGSGMQIVSWQTWPAGHAASQAPQCRAFASVSTQPASPQHVSPGPQAAAPLQEQAPDVQSSAAGASHAFPQPPQCAGAESVSTQTSAQQVRPSPQSSALVQAVVSTSGRPPSSGTADCWIAQAVATATAAPAIPPPKVRRIAHLPGRSARTLPES
jgi:hypothetical protein